MVKGLLGSENMLKVQTWSEFKERGKGEHFLGVGDGVKMNSKEVFFLFIQMKET